ncbi:hypothetical protein BJ742DRAFT_289788 [Cladochytrium replicatum]|nr:hypothetical protein BJ742DRAFT_289788 [Cladochytrium replicatum]
MSRMILAVGALGIFVGLGSFAFYLYVVLANDSWRYGSGYWGLLAFAWSILVAFNFAALQAASKKALPGSKDYNPPRLRGHLRSILTSPQRIFATIIALMYLISGIALFFARSGEQPAAGFALVAFLEAFLAAYLHHSASVHYDGQTSARLVKGRLGLAGYIIYNSFGALFGVIVFIFSLGATVQAVGLAADNMSSLTGPLPGTLFTPVGYSHRMHLYCNGTKQQPDDPIVWFEHGLGGQALDWSWVQQNVSQYARTCAVDHSGYGYSDVGPNPRGTQARIREVQGLLKAANITDDLLIVGHSMAGWNVRSLHRELTTNLITGVVFADPVVDVNARGCGTRSSDRVSLLYAAAQHLSVYGITRAYSVLPAFPEKDNIQSLPSGNSQRYFTNLFTNWDLFQRNAEQSTAFDSCSFALAAVNGPFANPRQASVFGITDATFGSMPYGLVLASNGINAENMGKLSTDAIVTSSPSTHVGLLHKKPGADVISDVVAQVFAKVRRNKQNGITKLI